MVNNFTPGRVRESVREKGAFATGASLRRMGMMVFLAAAAVLPRSVVAQFAPPAKVAELAASGRISVEEAAKALGISVADAEKEVQAITGATHPEGARVSAQAAAVADDAVPADKPSGSTLEQIVALANREAANRAEAARQKAADAEKGKGQEQTVFHQTEAGVFQSEKVVIKEVVRHYKPEEGQAVAACSAAPKQSSAPVTVMAVTINKPMKTAIQYADNRTGIVAPSSAVAVVVMAPASTKGTISFAVM